MSEYETLLALLEEAAVGTPVESVTNAISLYVQADKFIDKIQTVQKLAKGIVEDVIAETGQREWLTPAGKAQLTADSTRITYDKGLLDELIIQHPEIRDLVFGARKTTKVAGSLRISAPEEKK